MPAVPKKNWSVEQRWPTKKAREAADEAIEALGQDETMATYVDTWLSVYFANGGIEKKPK